MTQGIKGNTINKSFTLPMTFKCQKTKQKNNHWKLFKVIKITDMDRKVNKNIHLK